MMMTIRGGGVCVCVCGGARILLCVIYEGRMRMGDRPLYLAS